MPPEYPDDQGNGWIKYSQYVLKFIEQQMKINENQKTLEVRLAVAEVRCGLITLVINAVAIGLVAWLKG